MSYIYIYIYDMSNLWVKFILIKFVNLFDSKVYGNFAAERH
jgi:hypothetical protein